MRYFLAVIVCFTTFAPASASEGDLKRLDTRTRCIVLFHECLLLIEAKDVEAVYSKAADGYEGGSWPYFAVEEAKEKFRFTDTVKPKDAKNLEKTVRLKDRDKFIANNFRHSSKIYRSFDEILFSELKSEEEAVLAKKVAGKKGRIFPGTLHTMTIKIPGMDDPKFSVPMSPDLRWTELRFIEVSGKLYWVPFGW